MVPRMSEIPPPGKKRNSCLIYGCLGLFLVAMIALIGGYFVVRAGIRKVTAMVEKYSQPQAMKLPEITLSPEERSALKTRVAEFNKRLRDPAGAGGAELGLTGEEINVLLTESSVFGPLGQSMRVRIEDSRILGTISLPLSELGPFKMSGRYLNGEAALNLSLTNGLPRLFVEDLKVQGQTLPVAVLGGLKNVNLAERAMENPEFRQGLERFDSIRVSEGRLVLKAKP